MGQNLVLRPNWIDMEIKKTILCHQDLLEFLEEILFMNIRIINTE